MSSRSIRELLETGLNVYERKLNSRVVDELEKEGVAHFARAGWTATRESDQFDLQGYSWLRVATESTLERIFTMRRRHAEYTIAYSRAASEEERRDRILRYAASLGASRRQLRGDWRAFARWFGHDAIGDRYSKRHSALERRLTFLLGRLGVLAARIVREGHSSWTPQEVWKRLDLEAVFLASVSYDGDARIATAAFQALARGLRELPERDQEESVGENTLQFIYRSAIHERQDVWIQCEAVELLESLSAESLVRVLEKRLTQPLDGDDLFVRRRAVAVLGRNILRIPSLARLVPIVAKDPSSFVRQGLAATLQRASPDLAAPWLTRLAREDADPRVRAAALVEALGLLRGGDEELGRRFIEILESALREDEDEFVLRVAAHVSQDGAARLAHFDESFIAEYGERLREALLFTRRRQIRVRAKRWAGNARERIWSWTDPVARPLTTELAPWYRCLDTGKLVVVPGVAEDVDEITLARVLSALAQDEFGCEIWKKRGRWTLYKGHRFGFRFWRFLHELRTPTPDKRQAHSHTVGRVFRSHLRIPSGVLCELAETKVPGEPLFLDVESGWRPWLPLLDDCLSTLDAWGRRWTRIVSSEGVTEIRAPRGLLARCRAYWHIARKFKGMARLRNWRTKDDGSPRAYVDAIRAVGFEVRMRSHDSAPDVWDANTAEPAVDAMPPGEADAASGEAEAAPGEAVHTSPELEPTVARFFGLAAWPALLDEAWREVRRYFSSIYDNSLSELALFAVLASAVFLGRHWLANDAMQRARRQISLVLGGWGTRGKSGTERLKAGLINALGHSYISKTTGCEAMFLYANAFGKTREMFLFRPFDKATIWEQCHVVRLSAQLEAEVFLWECMALNPTYVRILQRDWMRDDISTITNTYPDHEDIQGPAGIDLPYVMCNFIPDGGTLYTSEEQMAPILTEASRGLGASADCVSWLESGLLTRDVLERFPYEEHPTNIALIISMARGLGIDRDFAVKEMADRVVPDLGVLKTFPPASVRSRQIEFTNGMSANERHGALGNWTRLGFDKHTLAADPGVWLTTVINNRADRIARSKVFAGVVARDVVADRQFLIGGNLAGLKGYIEESWEEHVGGLSLYRQKEDGTTEDPRDLFREHVARQRMPAEESEIEGFVRAIVKGCRPDLAGAGLEKSWSDLPRLRTELTSRGLNEYADGIVAAVEEKANAFRAVREIQEALEKGGGRPDEALDRRFRELLSEWFWKRIVVVEDYYATGNEIVDQIVEATPPGLFNRVIGMQNIKGTGLDFIYRYQAWNACHGACQRVLCGDATIAESAVSELGSLREFGVLDEELVRKTIETARSSPLLQREGILAGLDVVESNLNEALAAMSEKSGNSQQPKSPWMEWAIEHLEQFLDAGDSIRRRRMSFRIYRDLVRERISQERAVLELQKLTKRQKGGWLGKQLRATQGLVVKWRGLVVGKGSRRERERDGEPEHY